MRRNLRSGMSRFTQADDTTPYSERRQLDARAELERDAAHTYVDPETALEAGAVRPVDDPPTPYELRRATDRGNVGYSHLKGRR